MGKASSEFVKVDKSLSDLLGPDYVEAVCRASAQATGRRADRLLAAAARRVDFFPAKVERRLEGLLPKTGSTVVAPLASTPHGASTAKFDAAARTAMAPLCGFGYFRVGENGRLYLISKSEHYHAPLGHAFPGYELVNIARGLGIPNATHNNTRGFITRRLEEELVSAAAVPARSPACGPGALDRVLNLETGSLAVEAALKMILARFYRPQSDSQEPVYQGRIPVVLVVGDDDGGLQANYHGTTVLCQALRGMWGSFASVLEDSGAMVIRPVRPNRIDDVHKALAEYDTGKYKVAAFFHEIVMMNYGARLLTPDYLRAVYAMCRERDVPTVDDEIQSCMWHHELFMFKEWGLSPSFVAAGKGFPGGEYPASRILFSSLYDTLGQFGALVTNGQEELASLSYLVTMAWAEANADATRRIGEYFEDRVRAMAERHRGLVASIDGKRHMLGIGFADVHAAKALASGLNDAGLDISVQTYKSDCPPSALLKLPLIMGTKAVDFVLDRLDSALAAAEGPARRRLGA